MTPATPFAQYNVSTGIFQISGLVGAPEFPTAPILNYTVEVAEATSDTPTADAAWFSFASNVANVALSSVGDAWNLTWTSGFSINKLYMFRVKAGNKYGIGSPSDAVYAAWISSPESVQVLPLVQTSKIGLQVTWSMPTSSNRYFYPLIYWSHNKITRYAFNVAVVPQSGVGATIVSPNITVSNSSSNGTTSGASHPVYSVVITSLTAGAGYNISYDFCVTFRNYLIFLKGSSYSPRNQFT